MANDILLPMAELIDVIETVSPQLEGPQADQLAAQLRRPIAAIEAALASVASNPVLFEALGEAMRRIAGGMEGVAA